MSAGPRLRGRRAVVMGLGSFGGGLGAARYLARHGAAVLVTDLRPADELAEALGGLAASIDVGSCVGRHRRAALPRARPPSP